MSQWRDKNAFKARVREWAEKLGVHVGMITVRPMRKKWASCSSGGNLHFDSELLRLDRKLGEYVIVHELLHFSAPNHGKLWKSLMMAHLGNYQAMEARLKTVASRPAPRLKL